MEKMEKKVIDRKKIFAADTLALGGVTFAGTFVLGVVMMSNGQMAGVFTIGVIAGVLLGATIALLVAIQRMANRR